MFERYTESARRALFYARYETSQLGATSIEADHLLLAILRVGGGVVARLVASAQLSLEDVRKQIEARTGRREPLPTSIEIPFSPETKDILLYAAQEADRLRHNYIGTEHLLLGVLHGEGSFAASILTSRGVTLDGIRSQIAEAHPKGKVEAIESALPDPVPSFGMLRALVQNLARSEPDSLESRELLGRIQRVIQLLQSRFE